MLIVQRYDYYYTIHRNKELNNYPKHVIVALDNHISRSTYVVDGNLNT